MHTKPTLPRRPRQSTWVALAVGLFASGALGQATLQVTTLESVDPSGGATLYGYRSHSPSVSTDAALVGFVSEAPNLVPGDTNGVDDIFVRDRVAGVTELVSQSSAGVLADQDSHAVSVSRDGRYVAFSSAATNLVPGDTNGAVDVFVRDRLTGLTERVSVSTSGAEADLDSSIDIGRVHSISDDGRFVVFTSWATNLVPGSKVGVTNVYLRDRVAQATEQLDVSTSGVASNGYSEAVSISADGSRVAFASRSSNLAPGDGNGDWDVFVRDRSSGQTTCLSVDSSGLTGNGGSAAPAISGDGQVVAYVTTASSLLPPGPYFWTVVVAQELESGLRELVSLDSKGQQPPGLTTSLPSIDDDGRHVAFRGLGELAGYLAWPRLVYVHDRATGLTTLGSSDSEGGSCGSSNWSCSISPDGRFVGFDNLAACGVDNDKNGKHDVYLHDRRLGGAAIDLTNFVAGQVATLSITGGSPSGLFVLAWSMAGQAPIGTPFGILQLAPKVTLQLPLDGAGAISLPIQIGPATLGLEVWAQGLDVGSGYLSGPYCGVIQ
ncbi:MAG: calcium-binding protein [Planctomycetota bacterium]|nr:calcium-binding protein [Planctomycetota bacterium]